MPLDYADYKKHRRRDSFGRAGDASFPPWDRFRSQPMALAALWMALATSTGFDT